MSASRRTNIVALVVVALLALGGPASAAVKVAFESARTAGHLYTMRPDGSMQKRVGKGFGQSYPGQVSPNGKRVVFTRYQNGMTDVYIADIDGSEKQRLTNTPDFSEWNPSFSPDGKRVVYVAFDWSAMAGRIVVQPSAGGKAVKILTDDVSDTYWFAPSWSPDGTRIALGQSSNTGTDGIVTIRPNGNDFGMLAPFGGNAYITGVDWSPDGSQIVFSADNYLYKVNENGSNLVAIPGPISGAWPVWATASRILFTANDGDDEVFSIQPDGNDQQQLTMNDVTDRTGFFT